jgi:hypothetical protein
MSHFDSEWRRVVATVEQQESSVEVLTVMLQRVREKSFAPIAGTTHPDNNLINT